MTNKTTPTGKSASKSTSKRAIVLLSGGLDSATCAAQAIKDGYEVTALSFNYGQRHDRELMAAQDIVKALQISDHRVIKINLAQWGGSSLTDATMSIPTDGAELEGSGIPSTYVPGRNTVFIAIALSLAEAQNASAIYLGINAVDYSGYPDCRPEYLSAFQNLSTLSSKAGLEGRAPELVAPLVLDSKADIARRAIKLGVPIEKTWSCYSGSEIPCGRCDACRIRDAALIRIGRADLATPTAQARLSQASISHTPASQPPNSLSTQISSLKTSSRIGSEVIV
ncbi:MAG: 7-cyano-7-deazaguanine synthase QueC [Phormidesmis sp.]